MIDPDDGEPQPVTPEQSVPSKHRRARGVVGALGITCLSAVLPGSGYIFNRRRVLGVLVLLASLGAVVVVAIWAPKSQSGALKFAFDPNELTRASVILIGSLAVWVAIVVSTYVIVRPKPARRSASFVGAALVGMLCLAVAAPTIVTARDARTQAALTNSVFTNNQSATAPTDVGADDPWGGRARVNVLLLGGDGGADRSGVRTDSMILASIDTTTGRMVTFSLPRNMMYARFPKQSPLNRLYPQGFTGPGDAGNWMLNAVYREVPLLNPGVLGKTHNEGADAIKLAVEGSTGLRVDYYLLIDFHGFEKLVNAIGGVNVNINEPVAMGGNTDLGTPPASYLQPGPNRHLNGFQALWFARGRYGSDDYQRMDRQRCMINAIINKADPISVLRHYQALASASKSLVRTDIPRQLLPAFVSLAGRVKDRRMKSVVFQLDDNFNPGDPDFAYLRRTVARALAPRSGHHGARSPRLTDDANACTYQPVG